FSVEMSAAAAAALSRDPRVDYVIADAEVHLDASQSPAPGGFDRIDQRDLPLDNVYTHDVTGAGVHVYVIDTGLRTTHSEFVGRVGPGMDLIGGGVEDCHGHGTHVAGTIGGTTWGVAKQVTIHPVRVFDCN